MIPLGYTILVEASENNLRPLVNISDKPVIW